LIVGSLAGSLGSHARRRKLNIPKFEEYPAKIPSFRNERLESNGKNYIVYCTPSLGGVRDFRGGIWYWCYQFVRREKKMAKLPRAYQAFKRSYPEIWQAYDRLGILSHEAGPLDQKTRELIKLALAIGAKLEGAAHSHSRRALAAGATPKEVLHVVLLGITTLGFPSTITALTWIEDVLGRRRVRMKKRR
jgi:AhpD family alkylhydroperoxidase